MERRAADVQAIRIILGSATTTTRSNPGTAIWGSEALLKKAVDLWQKRFGHPGEIVLSQVPTDPDEMTSPKKAQTYQPVEDMKLNSVTNLVSRSDSPTKRGYLMILTDASQDVWEKRWFVLRRPYLHVFMHSNEQEETGVITLQGANVESDPSKEVLYGKPFVFTLFTSANSHALAAPSLKELQSWTSKLDPTRSFS